MRTVWHIGVERVVLSGVAAHGLDTATLSPSIERAVAATMTDAALPSGRRASASVAMRAGVLSGNESIAVAVAGAVVHALRGGGHRG